MQYIIDFFIMTGSFVIGAAISIASTLAIGFALGMFGATIVEWQKLKTDALANNLSVFGGMAGFVFTVYTLCQNGIVSGALSVIGLLVAIVLASLLIYWRICALRPPVNYDEYN